MELFDNAVFASTCGQTKTELFENAEVTLSIPIHSAPYWKLIQDGDGRFPFLSIDTYASSMRSQVSYCFQIDSSYTCGRTKTMRKCYEWTPIFWKTEKKSCVFKRIRIRMDRALVWMNENGGFRIRRFQASYRAYPVCDRCYRLSIVLAFSSGRSKTICICYVWTDFFR